MATDLDKELRKAGYSSLPLPRAATGPTAIIEFRNGQVTVVRDEKRCLPLEVRAEGAADTVQFNREYKLEVNGVLDLLAKLFGLGKAKADLNVKSVRSATVRMGGLNHMTIQTGELVDYLLTLKESEPCYRDLTAPEHLTIVAALKADTFNFSFKNTSGTTIQFTAAEATGLFSSSAGVTVAVSASGEIEVRSPSYVGIVTWNGRTMERERKKATQSGRVVRMSRKPASVLGPALKPADVERLWVKSLGLASASGGRTRNKTARRATRKVDRKPARKAARKKK